MSIAEPLASAPKRQRPRGAKVLMILGVVLLLLGIVLGRSGIGNAQGAARNISNSGDDIRNGFLVEVDVPGTGDVDLEPGRYDIFAVSPEGRGFSRTTTTAGPTPTDRTDDPNGYDPPDVVVTDPSGTTVLLRSPGIESTFIGATGELYAIDTFTVTRAGTYHVEVTGTGADKVGVGPTIDDGNFGKLLKGGLLGLVGFLGAGLGVVLGLAGLIWFLVAGDGTPKAGPAGLYAPGPAGSWPPPPTWGAPPGGPPPWGGPPPGTWGGPPPGAWGAPPPGAWPPPAGGPPGWAPPPGAPPPPVPPAAAPEPASDPGPLLPPSPIPPTAAPWGDAPPSIPEGPRWEPPAEGPGSEPRP